MEQLSDIVARALTDFAAAPDPASLEDAKARYLGKSGELAAFQGSLRSLPVEERKSAGAAYNAAKQKIDWNGFVPGIVDAYDRFNGQYYAAPIDFFIEVMAYRAKVTPDEIRLAEKIAVVVP